MLFQTFWAETDVDPSNHILLIAKIYNFLNLNCADVLNSNNCKQIKNIKINIFLNLNCLDVPNSKCIQKMSKTHKLSQILINTNQQI